jgi:hypothetical protein
LSTCPTVIVSSPETLVPFALARSAMLTLLAEAIWQAVSPAFTVYVCPPLALLADGVPELAAEGVLEPLGVLLAAVVPAAGVEVEAEAAGIFSVWPMMIVFGSLMLFADASAAVVTPYCCAILPRVSPCLIV